MTTLLRLQTMAKASRFNDAVLEKVRPFLGKDILEVGTGIGNFTEKLAARAKVTGVEIVPEFVAEAKRRFPSLEIERADMGAGIPDFLRGRSFDTIVCMNVLEHIEDDRRTLADFFKLLRPGGRAVLVVPAHRWLFNGLDAHDGHFRRYEAEELSAKLREAGFQIEHRSRFNLVGILGWFLNGKVLGKEELPEGQLGWYDRLVPFLFRAEKLVGPPAGLSLLAVGAKA
jgi:SAM-dependent methyltransferase